VAAVLSLKTGCGDPVLLSRDDKSRSKVSLPRLKVSRKSLRKEHTMKNLVDKPSKTVLYIITLLLFGTITLNGDAKFSTPIEIVEQSNQVIVEITETSDEVDNDIALAEVTEEVVSPKPQSKTEVHLSRGGPPPKQLSRRDIINTYVRDVSSKYGMDAELIMSVIQQESEYNPDAKNGNCLGLMQVSSYWHADRAARLGVTDFYDPYSNILLGVDYLAELMTKYRDIRLVLMLYNMEHETALRLYKNGQISNYAKTIIARAEEYRKGE
jgi:hypothetical protein